MLYAFLPIMVPPLLAQTKLFYATEKLLSCSPPPPKPSDLFFSISIPIIANPSYDSTLLYQNTPVLAHFFLRSSSPTISVCERYPGTPYNLDREYICEILLFWGTQHFYPPSSFMSFTTVRGTPPNQGFLQRFFLPLFFRKTSFLLPFHTPRL